METKPKTRQHCWNIEPDSIAGRELQRLKENEGKPDPDYSAYSFEPVDWFGNIQVVAKSFTVETRPK